MNGFWGMPGGAPGNARMSRRRPNRRRSWLVVSAPVVLALVLAGGYLILLPIVAHRAAADYGAGNYRSAAGRYAVQQRINVVEPWKAYFNAGTAHLRDGSAAALLEATVALDRARQLSAEEPAEIRCMVQTNLALAHESAGDVEMAAGDATMADVPALRAALGARKAGEPFDDSLVRRYQGLFGSGVNVSIVVDSARGSYTKAAEDYAVAETVRGEDGCPQAGPEKQKKNDEVVERLQHKRQDAEESEPSEQQDAEESGPREPDEPSDRKGEPGDQSSEQPLTPQEKLEADRQMRLDEQNAEAERQEDQQQQEFRDTYGHDDDRRGATTKRW